jgi:hypothetical protein
LRIEREIAADLPRASGDPGLFLCLLHRLLTVSAETLQPGGSILLRAVRDGATARVSLHPTGKRAESAAVPGTDDDEINRELARRLGGALLFEGSGVSTVRLSPFL